MKIAVAMSGGIDSTVTAILLKESGYDIVGINGRMTGDKSSFAAKNNEDIKYIADTYNFPIYEYNLENDFYNSVIIPFCDEYLKGRTPNPCVQCNVKIKFKKIYEFACSLGCDKIATGHYAKIKKTDSGRYYISANRDINKDQSYFLFMLSQDALEKIIFPLENLKKEEIREIARTHNLNISEKPESQEICFIPDNDYPGFIERTKNFIFLSGDIINKNGDIIGQHKGIHRYTIGQRRGLGIAAKEPLYVIEIDVVNNRIVVGTKDDLKNDALLAININYMKETSLHNKQVLVKMRSTQKPVKARLEENNSGIMVYFDEPQIGISPGQGAVFYNEDMDVLGGGFIEKGIRGLTV